MDDATILPYRTEPAGLLGWVAERALGRAAGAGQGRARGAKSLEGTATSAAALGFTTPDGALTPAGRALALADDQGRRALLESAAHGYPPYGELLTEIRRRGDRVTQADWIETWWAMRGMGNSASNRREGAATFGRIVDFTGLGRYVPGRRGHATRIEWAVGVAQGAVGVKEDVAEPGEVSGVAGTAPTSGLSRAATTPSGEMNRLSIPLGSGETVRLELPLRLSGADKARLLQLLDLLIAEER